MAETWVRFPVRAFLLFLGVLDASGRAVNAGSFLADVQRDSCMIFVEEDAVSCVQRRSLFFGFAAPAISESSYAKKASNLMLHQQHEIIAPAAMSTTNRDDNAILEAAAQDGSLPLYVLRQHHFIKLTSSSDAWPQVLSNILKRLRDVCGSDTLEDV